jgi:uncharacterized protein YcfJ
MRKVFLAAAVFTILAIPSAQAQNRTLTGAAIGAGAGAVVAGPVGAVAGGAIGAVVGGPSLRHRRHHYRRNCWRDRHGHRHCR